MDHYEWLEENLPNFFFRFGINYNSGIITAHGDKCYGAQQKWEENGLHFYHGVAIYLLTHYEPYSNEVRQTPNGYVDPFDWVLDNKERFMQLIPPVA